MKSCSTCAHIARQWSEHPCVSCQQGEERGNWEAGFQAAVMDHADLPMYPNLPVGKLTPTLDDIVISGMYRADSPATSAPARVELRTGDGLARKIRRRAIAREWSTYLGRKIRARDVRIMQGLADDVEGGE